MSATALLVIDAQESFRTLPDWSEAAAAAPLAAMQALADQARARSVPVVTIFHVDQDGAFVRASGFVRPIGSLRIAAGASFDKHRHSALAGSGLEHWLIRHGITRLIVSGIRTEQCCETTARHASDLGWDVTYVTEATVTSPMTDPAGRTHSVADIKAHTEMVLAGRFARIATVAAAFSG